MSFDGDQTLWDFETARTSALGEVSQLLHRRIGTTVSLAELGEARRLAATNNPGRSHEQIRRLSLEEVGRKLGNEDVSLVDEAYSVYMDVRHGGVKLYPEARPCLSKLKSLGYKLALTTNGNTKYRLLDLPQFDAVTVGQEDGVWKPDPAIYELTCTRLSVPSNAVVHVGDHAEDDYHAASKAGLQTWLISRDKELPVDYRGGRTLSQFLAWLGHK